MNQKITAKLRRLLSRRQLKHRLAKAAMVLSCMAVFCVTYMLVAPVLTQEWPAVCGLEEHAHTDECYTVELVAVEPESENEAEAAPGHIHTDGCYTETTTRELTCAEEEKEGHTHTDGCYETVSSLICTDESEEHVHTEGCYETTTSLTCTQAETEGHTHTDACYTETTTRELTCGLTEGEPEGTPETGAEAEPEYQEVRVLTCGLEEHTHEDACYHHESNEVRYYCDLEEHTHCDDCYFESSELRCTIPEHTHTDDCTVRPVDEPEADAQLITLDNTYTAQREDVTLTLTVQGQVALATETAEPGTEDETEASEPTLPAPEELELVVTECEDEAAYQTYEELAAENGEVMMVQVLNYSLNWNGRELDLSGCELAVELAPTEEFQTMLNATPDAALMTVENDLAEGGETADELEADTFSFTAYTEEETGVAAYAVSLGANPHFTVQYYANLERAVKTDYGMTMSSTDELTFAESGRLPLINTDSGSTATDSNKGGKLPKNGKAGENHRYQSPNSNPIATLSLNSQGKIVTAPQLTEIYQAEQFEYQRAPGLKYFNIVLNNSNSQYDLKEIWVLKPDADPGSLNKQDWTIHSYSSTLRFTNRQETADANSDFIYIGEDAVIRLVYNPKTVKENLPANFYDYDISNGRVYQYIWRAGHNGESDKTTNQDKYNPVFVNTQQKGINSPGNYTNTNGKTKLAFGNSNAGTQLGELKWNGYEMNKANLSSFMISTFGLVKGLDADGHLIYDEKVAAPKLFNDGSATGKTSYKGEAGEKYSLKFDRVGDTYTLQAVNGTAAQNLDKFKTLTPPASWLPAGYKPILSNSFWPMDSAPSYGTDGHDLKFGQRDKQNSRKFITNDATQDSHCGALPVSDDDLDHNSYFGMQYSVKFQLSSSYVGPLEYYFFGDDDMWVFLDNELVCDIGGVHSSVGEYVNLWDYIDRNELMDANGDPLKVVKTDASGNNVQAKDKNGNLLYNEDGSPVWEMTDYVKEYTLSFFYTERGASGSTCWMQFTLPTVVGVDLDSVLDEQLQEGTGSISVEKKLDGVENTDWFTFRVEGLTDNYVPDFLLRDANGNLIPNDQLQNDMYKDYIFGGNNNTFKIRAGDVLVLRGLNENEQAITITELDRNGYHTAITVDGEEVPDVEDTVTVNVKIGARVAVVFTNIASYELPSTGGSGLTLWYAMGILTLTAAACLVYKKRKDTERGSAM